MSYKTPNVRKMTLPTCRRCGKEIIGRSFNGLDGGCYEKWRAKLPRIPPGAKIERITGPVTRITGEVKRVIGPNSKWRRVY